MTTDRSAVGLGPMGSTIADRADGSLSVGLDVVTVMRQHLANAVFRAVENGRPVLRVTNSGVSARIDEVGKIEDQTVAFQEDVRHWYFMRGPIESTFYSRHGDLFVQICAALTVVILLTALLKGRRSLRQQR